ncbi:hypothetical protein OO306_25420 [Pseudomonas sp. DCB_AW]|uniref:hypothetical protein n=1 Tax=Pseudomonas sp. DCB_AW TaxID=2993596 RepID=UPI002248A3B5|nr:hypothetical protein [Pseudomonas sp. DCB_AW]MCX2688872.1 hypothetical protein [Pseudomonas sp. DCB_AW]GLO55401.1 hypothetical protein PPUJ20066_14370 [Pseudomonas putida]
MSNETLKAHFVKQIAATEKDVATSKIQKNKLLHEQKLRLLLSLQRYAEGQPTREDAMLADVVNDMLQALHLLESDKTFRDH